jgi:hypothetical protein
MGAIEFGRAAGTEESVDAAWHAFCAELEATARAVAGRFAQASQAHLSFTEVHQLAQLVDLARDGQLPQSRFVKFATQCLMQVAGRAVRTRFRPKYFNEYRCLNALWDEADSNLQRRLAMERCEPQPRL